MSTNTSSDEELFAPHGRQRGRIIAIALLLLVGAALALALSLLNPWLSIGAFLIIALAIIRVVPKKWRRLYIFLYLGLAIGLPLSVLIWNQLRPLIRDTWPVVWDLAVLLAALALGVGPALLLEWGLINLLAWAAADFCLGLDELLKEIPGSTRKFLAYNLLGVSENYVVVEDGKAVVTKPRGVIDRIGGPGLIIIKPGNAVAFEWGGRITKIEGPGLTHTITFERAKHIVDLNPKRFQRSIQDIHSQEGVPLQAHVLATFQIKRAPGRHGTQVEPMPKETKPNEKKDRKPEEKTLAEHLADVVPGAHPVNVEAIHRAIYRAGDAGWEQATRDAIEKAVAATINGKELPYLYPLEHPRHRRNRMGSLSWEALRRANRRTEEWGVSVSELDITAISAPPGVQARVLEAMQGEVRSQLRLEELDRLVRTIERTQPIVGGDVALRLVALVERLIDSMAGGESDDAIRLIQTVERFVDKL